MAIASVMVPSRQAEQVRDVLGAVFSHESRPMAFECPVADLQPHPTFLVGTAFSDEAEDFGLAHRQRYLVSRNLLRIRCVVVGMSGPRPPPDHLAALREGGLLPQRRFETVAETAHQGANAFGFAKRVPRDLLQRQTIAIADRKPVAALVEIIEIEQQRSQGPVELVRDRGSHLIRHAFTIDTGDVSPVTTIQPCCAAVDRYHCSAAPARGDAATLKSMASISCRGENGFRIHVDAPRCIAVPK